MISTVESTICYSKWWTATKTLFLLVLTAPYINNRKFKNFLKLIFTRLALKIHLIFLVTNSTATKAPSVNVSGVKSLRFRSAEKDQSNHELNQISMAWVLERINSIQFRLTHRSLSFTKYSDWGFREKYKADFKYTKLLGILKSSTYFLTWVFVLWNFLNSFSFLGSFSKHRHFSYPDFSTLWWCSKMVRLESPWWSRWRW